jgi:chemotaxis protein CheD
MTQIDLIKVGMADLNILKGAGILKTSGLGSCVGLVIYDDLNKVAGMAHVMLPSSDIAREPEFNRAKYADTAIPVLLDKLYNLGAKKTNLKAKMAGGSQMFTFSNSNSETLRIGPRNAESCKRIISELLIPIIAEDTGGNYGRTIEFQNDTGMLLIRSVHQGFKEI